MAVFDNHRASGRTGAFALSHLVNGAISSVLAWNDARRTEEALSRLSAHELDDIGLSKADVATMRRR